MSLDSPSPMSDLAPTDRRAFLRGAGAAAGASVLAVAAGAGSVDAAANASQFVPLRKPYRLADTREDIGYRFEAGDARVTNQYTRLALNLIRVKVRDRLDVPASASAVVLTVTAVSGAVPARYVTVYPSGVARPEASNLNIDSPYTDSGNLVFVKVGAGDSVDIFQYFGCNIVVDVLGYFEPVSGGVSAGRYKAVSPYRVIDTRERGFRVTGGTSVVVDLGTFEGARFRPSSVLVNVTAVDNVAGTFYSALPYSATGVPTTSSFNTSTPNDQRAGAAIVAVEYVGGQPKMRVYTHKTAHIIVDVLGYFTGPDDGTSLDGLFVPVDPLRVLDTRQPDPFALLWPAWVVEKTLPSSVPSCAAAVINLTSTETRGGGFLSINGARRVSYAPPKTSNVNWPTANATVPNLTVTGMATNGFEVYTSSGSHIIADLSGYFTGTPKPALYAKYVNPTPPAAPPEWTLTIPKLGITSRVMAGVNNGDSVRITDAGHSWHWTGTGYLGQSAHVAAFAHRTERATTQLGIDPTGRVDGVFRNIHYLVNGDEWSVRTGDRRVFVYRMVRWNITSESPTAILAEVRSYPGTTFSLVACSKTNREPTSLDYRLIVTGVLVRSYQV